MNRADFLVEIHTEELPPKALHRLAVSFLTEITTRLDKLALSYRDAKFFATPRRLAVSIQKLISQQKDALVERKGPALIAAFDTAGNPTPACIGFAKSCGVTPDKLTTIKNHQGEWVSYTQNVTGKSVKELLPQIVSQSLNALPIPKRMRWGNSTAEFVRPVKSVIMLFGKDIIEGEILGCKADRYTEGHRFLSKGKVKISSPTVYEKTLAKKFVLADFEARKENIRHLAHQAAPEGLTVLLDENLLEEVTGLVEWPVAIYGSFDKDFLNVPQEALISAMQDHQRYFPIVDEKGKLEPHFITISNIPSRDIHHVRKGNERVLRARLSDAAFFFEMDKKQKLQERVERLKDIVFQAKLGTLYDKTLRIAALAKYIATKVGIDTQKAERAAWLSKADLTTEMVSEFPELQGIMGYYYAIQDQEPKDIAVALNELYQPRFSGDAVPASLLGSILAIADRIDTLVGVFGIHQPPTGDKDPFALRRAALGILRIVIENALTLDLKDLIAHAVKQYANTLPNTNVESETLQFILERLKPWYQDKNISADVYAAVVALQVYSPLDFHQRIQAVQSFKCMPEAESLSIANKRVSNILAKYNSEIEAKNINVQLFEQDAEKALAAKLLEKREIVSACSKSGDYSKALAELAELRNPVDDFFEKVLVMAEDKKIRENRLLLLRQLRELFLHVADIAYLQ